MNNDKWITRTNLNSITTKTTRKTTTTIRTTTTKIITTTTMTIQREKRLHLDMNEKDTRVTKTYWAHITIENEEILFIILTNRVKNTTETTFHSECIIVNELYISRNRLPCHWLAMTAQRFPSCRWQNERRVSVTQLSSRYRWSAGIVHAYQWPDSVGGAVTGGCGAKGSITLGWTGGSNRVPLWTNWYQWLTFFYPLIPP